MGGCKNQVHLRTEGKMCIRDRLADGNFIKAVRKVGEEYPEIEIQERLVLSLIHIFISCGGQLRYLKEQLGKE